MELTGEKREDKKGQGKTIKDNSPPLTKIQNWPVIVASVDKVYSAIPGVPEKMTCR